MEGKDVQNKANVGAMNFVVTKTILNKCPGNPSKWKQSQEM